MERVNDHLHQGTRSSNWPVDEVVPGCSGVHEHWNNSTDQQYSQDLAIGMRIELLNIVIFAIDQNYVYVINVKITVHR